MKSSIKVLLYLSLAIITGFTAHKISTKYMQTKQQKEYRNIIFDVGGVLYSWNTRQLIQNFTQDNNINLTPELIQGINKAIHSPMIIKLNKGLISLDQANKQANAFLPNNFLKDFLMACPTYMKPLEGGRTIFNAAKKRGYKIFLLTNVIEEHFKQITQKSYYYNNVDGMIISYQVGMAKPDNNIYQLLLSRYNLKPEECYFIDDTLENVEAAQKLGIDSILCDKHEKVINKMKELNIID